MKPFFYGFKMGLEFIKFRLIYDTDKPILNILTLVIINCGSVFSSLFVANACYFLCYNHR